MARYFVLSSWMHTKPLMGPLRMAKFVVYLFKFNFNSFLYRFSSLNRISLVIALLAVMGALIVGNVEVRVEFVLF